MITLEHVTKSFKNGKESLKALDDVSLVEPQDPYAVSRLLLREREGLSLNVRCVE